MSVPEHPTTSCRQNLLEMLDSDNLDDRLEEAIEILGETGDAVDGFK